MKISSAIGLAALMATSPARAVVDCRLNEDISPGLARLGLCRFDAASRSFGGTAAEQAACLTRQVLFRGRIGDATITDNLAQRAGQPTGITVERLGTYTAGLGLLPVMLGGPFQAPVDASYFVIHDTSAPNCSALGATAPSCPVRGQMPANRDQAGWAAAVGYLGHPRQAPRRLAHAFTNRIGESITEVDFRIPFATTKFEQCVDAQAKSGAFVGVENIQPRTGVPPAPSDRRSVNDRIAPDPGFTAAQYDRLALLYVVASVRHRRWLIPAFHAVIDHHYLNGHDDPQNFDMQAFSAAVDRHIERLGR